MTQGPVVLTISCPDRTGLVAGVTSFLAAQNLFIDETHQFGDAGTGRFFMRTVFHATEGVWNQKGFGSIFCQSPRHIGIIHIEADGNSQFP